MKFSCEANADRDREDTLFVFRVGRYRPPRTRPEKYAAQLQLLTTRQPTISLDSIEELRPLLNGGSLIPQKSTFSSSPEVGPSEDLANILAHAPDDVRSLWAPLSVLPSQITADEFIEAFRIPWIKFRLEDHVRLTPSQESLVNRTVRPTQLGTKIRETLLDTLDFSMLNSYTRKNGAKTEKVHGLLKDLAALPFSRAQRMHVWAAMMAGLGKMALLRTLKESAHLLSNPIYESQAEAESCGMALVTLIKSLGEREHDRGLVELAEECAQHKSPLEHLLEWLGRQEFRIDSITVPGRTGLEPAGAELEPADAGPPKHATLEGFPSPGAPPLENVETIEPKPALDRWVLAQQVPDPDAFEDKMHEITERLLSLSKELPSGSLTQRTLGLVKVIGCLDADIHNWQASLPNPETLASDYQEAAEVYRKAREVLGNDVDSIIAAAKLSPRDLQESLRFLKSPETLGALPSWVWTSEDAPVALEGTENRTKAWIKKLIVPTTRERVSAVLDAFQEAGQDKLSLLAFVPPPEVDAEAEDKADEVGEYVKKWLQDFWGLLAPLPIDVRDQFRRQLSSQTDYKRLIYCAGFFRDLNDRLPSATCIDLVRNLATCEDLEQLYLTGDTYLKAVEQLQSLLGKGASDATFKQILALAEKQKVLKARPQERDHTIPSILIEHNWVDLHGAKAPLIYFKDDSQPYGSASVPLSLRTRHIKPWSLRLAVEVKSGQREGWPATWPPITPQELEIRDGALRSDLEDSSTGVYSFKLRVPFQRERGRGAGLKLEVTLIDRNAGVKLSQPQLLEWPVMNDSPPSIAPVWPQSTLPQYVEDHPIGPQRDSNTILAHLGKFGSFAVMAPRRFGKSTLMEYLKEQLRDQGFIVPEVRNCLNIEYFDSRGLLYDAFWSGISDDLQEKTGASINRPFSNGLPSEAAFNYVRSAARKKGKKGVVILIDEAQAFFTSRTGTAIGDTLKDRLERHWSRQDSPELVPLMIGLVGLPSLAERAGANLLGLLRKFRHECLEEDELNKLILNATDGHLHTTREARRRLAVSARNLYILVALVERLAERVFADERTWANYDDVFAVEGELKRELREGRSEDLAVYVKDALNDAERISDWAPNASLGLAVALASAKEKGVSSSNLREEAQTQLRAWCGSLKADTSIQRLGYDDMQFQEHLRILGERQVFEKGKFTSELLESWLLGLRHKCQSDPDTWNKMLVKAAVRRISLPDPLEKVDDAEGGQARVWTCTIDGDKYAVRKTSLRTSADRQRFVEEKGILDELREFTAKGSPGHEYVFTLKEVGLSADDDGEAIQIYRWIPGYDLSRRIGQLDGPFVAELGRKLGRALLFLHNVEILHRDIRPQNVIISEENFDPIIIDFGFARRLTSRSKTSLGDEWAAPEVRGEHPAWSPAADVFSLGATLRGVLTSNEQNNPLRALLDSCCSLQPTARPQTCDLEALFRGVAGNLHVDAKKVEIWRKVSDLSRTDRERHRWFEEVLDKFQPKFEAIALGCGNSLFDRARVAADFLNQVLEASSSRELSLGRAKAILDGPLATDEIDFLYGLRTFESHGRYRQETGFYRTYGHRNDEEIRETISRGTKQIADFLSSASLVGIVEAII